MKMISPQDILTLKEKRGIYLMYFVIINYMALSIGISVGVVKISEFQIYGISEPQGKPFQKQIGLPNCVINVPTILVKRYCNPWLSHLLQLNIIISQFF